jgi:surfactin synthase thioesterase subunit
MTGRCILGKPEHANPRANLYIFPHSGGMPGMYMQWKHNLEEVNVFGVQYPGRGSRILESPCLTVDDIVSDILTRGEFVPPYILMGHSLGAIIAYEVAARASSSNPPLGLIVSAMSSPNYRVIKPGSSQLRTDEFLKIIQTIDPCTLMDLDSSAELRDHFIDVLRNDMRAAESYICKLGRILTAPIVFMGGSEDSIPENERLGWSHFTSVSFESRMFQGGHFYFRENPAIFFEFLNQEIRRMSEAEPFSRISKMHGFN